jgi:TatD DNase family protein
MNQPKSDDYIDIHDHGGSSSDGHFSVENLMAHESRIPDLKHGVTYSYGIHPWYLDEENYEYQIGQVRKYADHSNVLAVGEAGFDRLRGPSAELQLKAFEEQVEISETLSKPLFIHCVRAWDALLQVHKRLKPARPWIVHGFRGKTELANQLISRGMYLSFWFDFILRPESALLIRNLPAERIFFETDGSGIEISKIYEKVAADLETEVPELKNRIRMNYEICFIK